MTVYSLISTNFCKYLNRFFKKNKWRAHDCIGNKCPYKNECDVKLYL